MNDQLCHMEIRGSCAPRLDRVLLDSDDDLTALCSWSERGFAVLELLDAPSRRLVREGVRQRVRSTLHELGQPTPEDFDLRDYHRYVDRDSGVRHRDVVARTGRHEPIDALGIAPAVLEDRVSDICGLRVTLDKPELGGRVFAIRIIRPRSRDHNPLHRDAWLSVFRHGLNAYLPIAGSSDRSSLCVVPGSHLWSEADIDRTQHGAWVDGVQYHVPAVTACCRPLELQRPNPALDEVLLFSPYLIHGASFNLNDDETRVSVELRFFRDVTRPKQEAPRGNG